MRLSDFVIPEAILPDLKVDTKEAAVRKMVESLASSGSIHPEDQESIIAAILKREELGSTGIGNGVAVPHTKHPSVDRLVATIFVNRLQFAPHEDFDSYPRSLGADCSKLEAEGVDIVFAPTEKAMYPEPQRFHVDPPEYSNTLEGAFRPGFFRGVATVVLKLFNIVRPQIAVFGKKDYQQLLLIRDMVRQLELPIEVLAGEIARAPDGLALSSRNAYLSTAERAEAPRLAAVLQMFAASVRSGDRDFATLETLAMERLRERHWQPDYVAVRRRTDLQSPAPADRELVIVSAARLGTTRLIDNLEVTVP